MINEVINYIKNAYDINPIAQIVGFIGFFLAIIAFLFKNDKKTKIIHGISLVFWAIHFLLLGLYTAVAVDAIGIVRNFSSIKKKGSNKIIILLVLTYILFGIITYKDIFSFFPVLSGILATYAFFKLEGIKFRLLLIICSSLWVIYSLIGQSIGGVALELLLIISHLITIGRLFFERKIIA